LLNVSSHEWATAWETCAYGGNYFIKKRCILNCQLVIEPVAGENTATGCLSLAGVLIIEHPFELHKKCTVLQHQFIK